MDALLYHCNNNVLNVQLDTGKDRNQPPSLFLFHQITNTMNPKIYKKKAFTYTLVAEESEFHMTKLSNSLDVADFARKIWNDGLNVHESFYIILVNRRNNTIGYKQLSIGGVSSTLVDMKILFKYAINALASGIFLAHNHPSFHAKPGSTDITLTKRIAEACKVLDIDLIDHIILTNHSYYSFKDENLI